MYGDQVCDNTTGNCSNSIPFRITRISGFYPQTASPRKMPNSALLNSRFVKIPGLSGNTVTRHHERSRWSARIFYFIKERDYRWNSTGFRRRLCLRLLWPWPLTFWCQNLISRGLHPWTQVHLWPKLGETPFTDFCDMVFARLSGRTDSLTHGRTRPKNNVSSTEGLRWQRCKKSVCWVKTGFEM